MYQNYGLWLSNVYTLYIHGYMYYTTIDHDNTKIGQWASALSNVIYIGPEMHVYRILV